MRSTYFGLSSPVERNTELVSVDFAESNVQILLVIGMARTLID